MVFPPTTPEGRDDNHCRHASSPVRESQFWIEPRPPLRAVAEKRVAEDPAFVRLEALPNQADGLTNENEIERRFREQLVAAKYEKEAGKLDDARQQLLVMVFDPCLPVGVIQELAAALSDVDLARFSLSLCERLIESDWENAGIAYDLAVYSSMCGKPQYVTDMYLLKACELEPGNARYRLAFVCWLLTNQRNEQAIVHSGSPEQYDLSIPVCGDCLSWVVRKFTEQGKVALANAWRNCVSACVGGESSDCCRNFRDPSQLRRAW